jgi:hypothetical protein
MRTPLNKIFTAKALHLKISAIVILIIGLAYGVSSNKIFLNLFDFTVQTTDLKNIFRATMGLYFGMVAIWIAGIIKPRLWVTATITNIAFMGGLAVGRVISLLADGIPSAIFLWGLAAELILACWGVFNLKSYSSGAKE